MVHLGHRKGRADLAVAAAASATAPSAPACRRVPALPCCRCRGPSSSCIRRPAGSCPARRRCRRSPGWTGPRRSRRWAGRSSTGPPSWPGPWRRPAGPAGPARRSSALRPCGRRRGASYFSAIGSTVCAMKRLTCSYSGRERSDMRRSLSGSLGSIENIDKVVGVSGAFMRLGPRGGVWECGGRMLSRPTSRGNLSMSQAKPRHRRPGSARDARCAGWRRPGQAHTPAAHPTTAVSTPGPALPVPHEPADP